MILNWGAGSEDYFGLQTLIRTWLIGGGAATVATQRGNVDYDQIRVPARHGTGTQIQMFSGGPSVAGQAAVFDGAGNLVPSSGTSGTVASVGLTVPSRQSVAGSPVTSSGTFAITDNTQSANLVFAGPTTGSAAAPGFRALVSADVPNPMTSPGDTIYGGTSGTPTRLPGGTSGYILTSNGPTSAPSWQAGGGVPLAITAGPDWPPATAGSLDDEFTAGSLGGAWSWVNQGSVTATLANSWLSLALSSSTAGDSITAILQSTPGTPWEVTAKIALNSISGNWLGGGIVLRESSSGKLTMWGPAYYSGRNFDVSQWNSTTSNNSDTTGGLANQMACYLRVKDDGTNLKFSLSADGVSFVLFNSRGRTAFMSGGPNQVGLGYNCQVVSAAGTPIAMGCDWFRRTL